MKTLEGKIKDQVKAFLKERGAWFTVGTGLATLPIDIIGCYKGRFFAIEVKAPGKEPTAKQNKIMWDLWAVSAFVIWGDSADDIISNMAEFLAAETEDEFRALTE